VFAGARVYSLARVRSSQMPEPLRTIKEDSSSIELRDAGALPPPSDEDVEEGKVLRDHDILSEEPEIDTTRAEPPPRRLLNGFVVCALLYCVTNVLMLTITAIAASYYGSHCDLSSVKALVTVNVTTANDVLLHTTLAYNALRSALAECAYS